MGKEQQVAERVTLEVTLQINSNARYKSREINAAFLMAAQLTLAFTKNLPAEY